MIVNSNNEWDKLHDVVVGVSNFARFPTEDPLFSMQSITTKWKETSLPQGNFDKKVKTKATENLMDIVLRLEQYGIKTRVPAKLDYRETHNNYYWETDGMYGYCPRDVLLVVGNRVIETPMAYRSRWYEFQGYEHIKRDAIKDGAVWFSAPKPALFDDDFKLDHDNNKMILTEDYPIFDAANVCRVNDDLLYLVSETGNYRGGEWLQQMLPDKTVHILDNLYSYAHIDSTICPLKEGLVMLNANRVNESNCPKVFKDWEKIYITEEEVVAQYFKDYPYASKWIALNLLVIEPGLVLMESGQPYIKKRLEAHGIEVIDTPMDMARTLGGGIHCCTLDLHRS